MFEEGDVNVYDASEAEEGVEGECGRQAAAPPLMIIGRPLAAAAALVN